MFLETWMVFFLVIWEINVGKSNLMGPSFVCYFVSHVRPKRSAWAGANARADGQLSSQAFLCRSSIADWPRWWSSCKALWVKEGRQIMSQGAPRWEADSDQRSWEKLQRMWTQKMIYFPPLDLESRLNQTILPWFRGCSEAAASCCTTSVVVFCLTALVLLSHEQALRLSKHIWSQQTSQTEKCEADQYQIIR